MLSHGKALVPDVAKEQDTETQCPVVVAQDSADIKASMNLLNRYADRVAVHDSGTDMQLLFGDWARVMNQPMPG